jgi:hypothetical protein
MFKTAEGSPDAPEKREPDQTEIKAVLDTIDQLVLDASERAKSRDEELSRELPPTGTYNPHEPPEIPLRPVDGLSEFSFKRYTPEQMALGRHVTAAQVIRQHPLEMPDDGITGQRYEVFHVQQARTGLTLHVEGYTTIGREITSDQLGLVANDWQAQAEFEETPLTADECLQLQEQLALTSTLE